MKTILVTAVGSFSADAVIKTYKREGYRVVGCDIYPAQWVANSHEVEVFYKAPYATDQKAYVDFMKKVCQDQKVDYVVPLTDVEVDVLTQLKPGALGGGVCICISGQAAIGLCRDKYRMEQFLKPLGICETIPGILLSELFETGGSETGMVKAEMLKAKLSDVWLSDLERFSVPLVVKPLNGRSSQGLHIVKTREELLRISDECRQEAENYLVQPKISGTIVTVDVVREPDSGRTFCLPRRELLRTLNGAGTSVYVFRDERLESQCGKLAEAIGITGCVNMEFVETETDGHMAWHFLECNPRFSGGVAFSCMAGYDMVKNHLRCFTGQPIDEPGEIQPRYIARKYQEYVME